MKKKLLLSSVFIINIFFWNITFWGCNNSCNIKNWPPEVFTNYIKNLHKIISNYSVEISKLPPKKWLEKDYTKTKASVQKTFNKTIEWSWYFTNFDFYVLYWAKNEYVPEIWRDYNELQKESVELEKYLKKIINKWYEEEILDGKKICDWVKDCNLSWTNVDILSAIIKNHDNVKDYFKLSIIGKRNNFNSELILVPPNFKNDLYVYYNENTTNNCSKCEWWFFDRVSKQAEKITNWQENAKNWIKSWQDAIAILDGSLNDRQYERLERQVLEKELNSKWISINASSNILKTLWKYNETWWFSADNNFITNSYNYVKDAVKSQIKSFSETVLQKFKNGSVTEIPNVEFSQTRNDLTKTANIEEVIAELYNKELPSAQFQDLNTQNLQSKMIEMHYNLSQAIKTFDGTKKTSQKVCNSQWQWLWICE